MTDRFKGESEPIATNPILRGVDLAMDRLVRADCFADRTVSILDDLRAEVLGVDTAEAVRAHYATSAQQEEQSHGDRGADHEEQQTDDRPAAGRLSVAGSHAKSMAQAPSHGKSQYGEGESRGEAVDVAVFNVASGHHIHGTQCLCGFESHRARSRTEHVIDATLAALAAAGIVGHDGSSDE